MAITIDKTNLSLSLSFKAQSIMSIMSMGSIHNMIIDNIPANISRINLNNIIIIYC